MAGLADFHLHVGRERGGNAQPRAENFQDERVAHFDQFHAAAKAHAKRLEALHFLVVGRDLADDGADTRRKQIQPDESGCGLISGSHNLVKINCPTRKSTRVHRQADASKRNLFFIRLQDNRHPAIGLPVACDFLSVNCGGIMPVFRPRTVLATFC